MKICRTAAAAAALCAIAGAGTAYAHQTVTSNGARVSLHVDPNDEPEAGSVSTIRVISVKVPRGARFAYSRCGCRLRITNSAGATIANHAMRTRLRFTFPRAGAYRLTYSGKYTRGGRTKRFNASFAIRAF